MEHCISLFAGNIIFFLTNLRNSINNLIGLIKYFGGFSGYKLIIQNPYECSLIRKNDYPKIHTPFMTTTEGFRYLGVKITPELNEITLTKYNSLLEKITEALNRWSTLPISMTGQINLIKMTTIFILFSNTPTDITKDVL